MAYANADSGLFATFERRYHILHILAAALLAAATIAVFLMWFAPRPAWGPPVNLSLAGSVPASTYITITPEEIADGLDLAEGVTVTKLKIADIFEKSNSPDGYSITVTSTNLQTAGRCTVNTAPCLEFADADAADDVSFTLWRDTADQIILDRSRADRDLVRPGYQEQDWLAPRCADQLRDRHHDVAHRGHLHRDSRLQHHRQLTPAIPSRGSLPCYAR
jgi:hypothetical protein